MQSKTIWTKMIELIFKNKNVIAKKNKKKTLRLKMDDPLYIEEKRSFQI